MPYTVADEVKIIELYVNDDDIDAATALSEDLLKRLSEDPRELSVHRSKNNFFGAYARDAAKQYREDETQRERAVRLGGEISEEDVPYGEGLARSYLAGGTLEFGDEIIASSTAFLNQLFDKDPNKTYSEVYDAYLSRERRRADDFARRHPGSDISAKIAGGVFSPFWKPLSLLGKLSLIPRAAKITTPATVGQTVRQGAKAGAYGGFLYGLGAGEGLEGRATSAAIMAPGGALLGGALSPLFYGSNVLAQKLLALRAKRRAGRIKKAPGGVTREVQDLAITDEVTLGGAARLAKMGDDAILADAGPAMAARLDQIIQSAGPGALEAQQAIQARGELIGRKLTKELDDVLGGLEAVKTKEQLASLYTNAGKIYSKAYGTPINYASDRGFELLNLINSFPARVVTATNELLRIAAVLDKSIPSKKLKFTIGDAGNVTWKELPTVAQIDYLTRGLKSIVEKEEGVGLMGGTTTLGIKLMELSSRTRTLLKELVPSYRDALKISAGNITDRNARLFGQEILKPAHDRQDVFSALEGMGERQLFLVKKGLRQYIDDLMAKTKRAMDDPTTDDNVLKETMALTRDLSSRINRDKLQYLLGEADAGKVFSGLERQEIALQLKAQIKTNTKTYARLVTDKRAAVHGELNPLNILVGGSPVKAGQQMLKIGTGTDPASMAAARQQHDKLMAEILSGPARGGPYGAVPEFSALTGSGRQAARDAELLAQALVSRTAPSVSQIGGMIPPMYE